MTEKWANIKSVVIVAAAAGIHHLLLTEPYRQLQNATVRWADVMRLLLLPSIITASYGLVTFNGPLFLVRLALS